jgi:hypothetical protein
MTSLAVLRQETIGFSFRLFVSLFLKKDRKERTGSAHCGDPLSLLRTSQLRDSGKRALRTHNGLLSIFWVDRHRGQWGEVDALGKQGSGAD